MVLSGEGIMGWGYGGTGHIFTQRHMRGAELAWGLGEEGQLSSADLVAARLGEPGDSTHCWLHACFRGPGADSQQKAQELQWEK